MWLQSRIKHEKFWMLDVNLWWSILEVLNFELQPEVRFDLLSELPFVMNFVEEEVKIWSVENTPYEPIFDNVYAC